ncbi:putative quinone oxidoreductase [Rhizodiscina lignyota]|uniref:Quinone oxidoreductase n=1 Tax=Rhizodiscina lignyota TaxID=1504668 RepID=A0A9P4ILN9_9PEZI|nr:putative quinone oxidoreductase [Rhizodiscina lignyota]
MRVIDIKGRKGTADDLFMDDNYPDPVAETDRIVVRIKAFGLNRMDIMQRESVYPLVLFPESGPLLGVEFSGLVEEKGPECKLGFKIGDRVFGLAYGSAYAEKISVRERMLIHMPPDMSFETAAGIPETFFTSMQAIYLVGNLQKGQNVLVHGGASGVGSSAIQIAKWGGAAKVITTAGTDEKCKLCESLGADVAVNYKKEDFAEVVKRETDGRGVDLIVDLVGKDYWLRNVASAAMEAKMVIVASLSGSVIPDLDFRVFLNKRLMIQGTTLRNRTAEYQNNLRDAFVEKCMYHFAVGNMKVPIDKVYPWTQVADAHRRMEANINAGKIICTTD